MDMEPRLGTEILSEDAEIRTAPQKLEISLSRINPRNTAITPLSDVVLLNRKSSHVY
jgi:hypothetical protein